MTSRWMTAFLAATLAHGALSAGADQLPSTRPTSRPSAMILALVHDLTSDQFSTRQIAQNKLEQMGEEATPQLQEMLKDPSISDEASARIRTALLRIQEGRQFGPSIITIHCHDAPLAGVLEDFASQAGAGLGVDRPEIREFVGSRKISLDLDHVDFWTALRAVEDASHLHARPNNGNGPMILDQPVGWFEPWNGRSRAFGPCLVGPQAVNWSIQFGPGGNITSNLSIQLAAMVEPKLRVVGSFNGNWLRQCVDDKGHQLAPVGLPMNFGGPVGQWYTPLVTNLQVVPGMGNKIAKLTGEMDFTIQTKSDLVAIDDLTAALNISRTAGENTITIQKFTSANGQYQLQLSATGPAAQGRWDIIQNLISTLRILDEKDRPLQLTGTNSSSSPNGQMSIILSYINDQQMNGQPSGVPKKLRWEITTETRQIKVPFELDDIELPHAEDEVH
ncbi:MAG TPA: hypothetical protein VGG44_12465 [Tepidisphaeraceae bacterium]